MLYEVITLVRRDSLAKYRAIPRVLDSLELYQEGTVASIVARPEWLKDSGAHPRDTEVVLDMVLSISIVKIAFFLRITDDKVRVSIRSKGTIDVSAVAKKFDGGGHVNAAGCSIGTLDIDEAKQIVLKEILETTKE